MKRQILLLLWLVVGGIVVAHADTNTVMPLDVKLFKAGRVVAEPTVDSIVVWEKELPPPPPQVIPGKNLLVLAGTEVYLNGEELDLTAPGVENCRFLKATLDDDGNIYILANVLWLYTDDDGLAHSMVSNLVWKNFDFDAEYVFEYTGSLRVNSFAVAGDKRYVVFEMGTYTDNVFRIELAPVITCNSEIISVGGDNVSFSSWKCVDGELRGAASVDFDSDYHSTDEYFTKAMVCCDIKADGTVTPLTEIDLSRSDIVLDFAVTDGKILPVGSVYWCSADTVPYFGSVFNTGGGWWNYEYYSTTYSYVYGLGYLADGRRVLLAANNEIDRVQVLVDGWTPLYTLDQPPLDHQPAAAPTHRASSKLRVALGYKLIVDGNDVYATSILPSENAEKTLAGVWKNGELLYYVWELMIDDILLY